MALQTLIGHCYLCNKPLETADYCAIEVRCGGVGVHEECIKGRNRMLSREAFLRAMNRRVQNKQTWCIE
jgi:hypothetical protein